MPLDYNPSKWNTALTACQEALTLANEQKYTQFQIANESEIPEECWPKDLIQYALKMQIMDKKNMEVIWADTRTEVAVLADSVIPALALTSVYIEPRFSTT